MAGTPPECDYRDRRPDRGANPHRAQGAAHPRPALNDMPEEPQKDDRRCQCDGTCEPSCPCRPAPETVTGGDIGKSGDVVEPEHEWHHTGPWGNQGPRARNDGDCAEDHGHSGCDGQNAGAFRHEFLILSQDGPRRASPLMDRSSPRVGERRTALSGCSWNQGADRGSVDACVASQPAQCSGVPPGAPACLTATWQCRLS